MSDNEPAQPKKKGRGPGRPFQKGQSGNPSGQAPKLPPELRAWCVEHTPAILDRIVQLAGDPDGNVAIKACQLVLQRADRCGSIDSLPPAPIEKGEALEAAEKALLRLGLAGETAALRAYLAANDARYSQREEQASTGSVDALNFGPALDSVDVSKASDEDLAAELARRQSKAST